MRVTFPRIVVPFLVLIVFGIAQAQTEDPPPDVDEARQNERYAIQPGAEELFADMLARGETLAGGCKLTDGKIERTAVVATYGCADGQVVLELLHPANAPSSATRTERFAVANTSGSAPAGLVETIAERVRAREAKFAWTELSGRGERRVSWLVVIAGALAVLLALWALRRRAARRERSS